MPPFPPPLETQTMHWQHIVGFVGTLSLLALLIYAKPAFLLDSHSDSAVINAARCSDGNSYAMGIK